MKIAIQGHPTRGKEVIQILESLGGINEYCHKGQENFLAYYIYESGNIGWADLERITNEYKLYTLEEFEKEFPFKVGDLCIYQSEYIGDIKVKVLRMTIQDNDIVYEIGPKDTDKTYSGIYRKRDVLKPYKEMKEERNITLTLDKAKEWYKKGGELKEIALQAFTERELNPLPRSWKEFCENNPIQDHEAFINYASSNITICKECMGSVGVWKRKPEKDRCKCVSQKSAEAHLAMMQLEQLRNCWWDGWEPIWDCSEKWCIHLWGNELGIGLITHTSRFLTFPTKEMTEEFLKCFKDLIEKAKDLI